jgi:hypothetical protein
VDAGSSALARQGHLYLHGGTPVIALESGALVLVREVAPAEPLGVGPRYIALAASLVPQPMKYFHGQVPGG